MTDLQSKGSSMKVLIITALTALVLSVTASAGGPNLCIKGGWVFAQSGSGQAFGSQKDCQRSREVFKPSVALNNTGVQAGDVFEVKGAGFHPGDGISIAFAISGQAPYLTLTGGVSDSLGAFTQWTFFTACGSAPPYYLTITMTDAHGVHAQAPVTLC